MKAKKIFASSLALVLLLTCTNTFAAEYIPSTENSIYVLKEFGFSDIEISQVKDIAYLAQLVITNPTAIERVETVTFFDEFKTMRECLYTPDSELLNRGYTSEQIEQVRTIANNLLSMETDEIISNFGRSDLSSENIKNLLSSNPTTRATIPLSKLKVSITKYLVTGSGKAIHYSILFSFKWQSPPLLCIGEDQIALAWGGDLATLGFGSAFEYNNGDTRFATTISENPINAGVKYTFPADVRIDVDTYSPINNGAVSFELYQNSASGKDSKIVAYYAHKTVAISSSGVTITPSTGGISVVPSISFGFGYDYSEQASNSIGV